MSTIAAAAGIADRIDYWIRQHVIPYCHGIKALRTATESKHVAAGGARATGGKATESPVKNF